MNDQLQACVCVLQLCMFFIGVCVYALVNARWHAQQCLNHEMLSNARVLQESGHRESMR